MPTYQYRCTQCGNELEAVQKFTDPALTECPQCSGALRKIYSAVGVVFKGSGFYRTDSRAAAKDGQAVGTDGKGTEDAGKSADGSKTNGAEKTKVSAEAGNGSSRDKPSKVADPKPTSRKPPGSSAGKVPAGSGSSSTGG